MPSLKGISAQVLYDPKPEDKNGHLEKLTEYKALTHPNKRQSTCWIEAEAGQRFYLSLHSADSKKGLFPILDVGTVEGGLEYLHSRGIITNPSRDPHQAHKEACALLYRYLICIYIDGGHQPALKRAYGRSSIRDNTIVVYHGLSPDTGTGVAGQYIWQFQSLNHEQKADNDLLEGMMQMGVNTNMNNEPTSVAGSNVGVASHEQCVAESTGLGKIDIRIHRIVPTGTSDARSCCDHIESSDPLSSAIACVSGSNKTISATHFVEDVFDEDVKLCDRINFEYIDPKTVPYARFVFNYRDAAVLEKYGIKPSENPTLLEAIDAAKSRKRGLITEDADVPTKRTASVGPGGGLQLTIPIRPRVQQNATNITQSDPYTSVVLAARPFGHLADVTAPKSTTAVPVTTLPTKATLTLVIRPRTTPNPNTSIMPIARPFNHLADVTTPKLTSTAPYTTLPTNNTLTMVLRPRMPPK